MTFMQYCGIMFCTQTDNFLEVKKKMLNAKNTFIHQTKRPSISLIEFYLNNLFKYTCSLIDILESKSPIRTKI